MRWPRASLARGVVVIAMACALPLPAAAWSGMGHQIVAELASRELSASALAEVRRLLGRRGMASVASWADEIRRQRPATRSWHYVNIPRDAALYDPARDCAGKGCIVAALEQQLGILRDRRRSNAARSEALKYVIHLVGDLHQPLHCADDDDHGGNEVRVRWFGRKTTLHRVWDDDILKQAHLSAAQQVALLREIAREMPRRDALQLGSLADWTNESHALAVDTAYDVSPTGALGPKYYDSAFPIVRLQLLRAGLRLARLLNESLADSVSVPAEAPRPTPGSVPARSCIPREQCCKVCSESQACGASCIRRSDTCRGGRGCACDDAELCR